MIKRYNLSILILPLVLFSLGYITLLSTADNLIRQHLFYFLVGIVLYFLFSRLDYTLYRHFWKVIYGVSLLLLLLTTLFAELKLGAARWLQFGSLSFQTSEFAKIALIIALSQFIISHREDINKPLNLLKLFLLITPVAALVFIQPDLGTTAVIIATGFGLVLYGGLSKYYLLIGLFSVGIVSTPLWGLLKDYQKQRILVFLNPQLDVLGSGYNVIQSIIAIGSGGLTGKGFGHGTQSSLEFLPAYWTDFIFASFAEEWGFLGVFLLITLFVMLLIALLYLASKIEDNFGRMMVVGFFFIFLLQFLINVGMNLGLMPVTGVTLPLISYGGTSLVFSLISLGIIQNIWLQNQSSLKF